MAKPPLPDIDPDVPDVRVPPGLWRLVLGYLLIGFLCGVVDRWHWGVPRSEYAARLALPILVWMVGWPVFLLLNTLWWVGHGLEVAAVWLATGGGR